MKKLLTLLLLATLLLTACVNPNSPLEGSGTTVPTDNETTSYQEDTTVFNETTSYQEDTTKPNELFPEPEMERFLEINTDNIDKIAISTNSDAYIYTVEMPEIEQILNWIDQIRGEKLGKINTSEYPQYENLYNIILYSGENFIGNISIWDYTHCGYLSPGKTYVDYEMMQTDMLEDLISYCGTLVEHYLTSIEVPAIYNGTIQKIEIYQNTYPLGMVTVTDPEEIEEISSYLSSITGEVIGSTCGYAGPLFTISLYDDSANLRTKLTLWADDWYELDAPYPFEPKYSMRLRTNADLQPLKDICATLFEKYWTE